MAAIDGWQVCCDPQDLSMWHDMTSPRLVRNANIKEQTSTIALLQAKKDAYILRTIYTNYVYIQSCFVFNKPSHSSGPTLVCHDIVKIRTWNRHSFHSASAVVDFFWFNNCGNTVQPWLQKDWNLHGAKSLWLGMASSFWFSFSWDCWLFGH